MSKMGSHCPFEHLKHKLWSKERPRVKLVWLLTTKSQKSTRLLVWRQHATYHWKDLDQSYNFASNFIAIRGLHAKSCAPKVAKVPIVKILGLPLGSPRTKNHLDVAPMERRIIYYKGEGGGFPQVRAMVSRVSPSCMWFVLAPKVLQPCTNHLLLVLCTFVWVIETCQFFLFPFQSCSMPLYPSKVMRTRERALTPYSSVVFNLDSHLNPSRSWERIIC
jgi:hypothetical protein